MNKIVVDETLRAKLKVFNEETEFCDESGRALGLFLPMESFENLVYGWARNQFTDEELEHARNQAGGYTTAEVLEYLKSL